MFALNRVYMWGDPNCCLLHFFFRSSGVHIGEERCAYAGATRCHRSCSWSSHGLSRGRTFLVQLQHCLIKKQALRYLSRSVLCAFIPQHTDPSNFKPIVHVHFRILRWLCGRHSEAGRRTRCFGFSLLELEWVVVYTTIVCLAQRSR